MDLKGVNIMVNKLVMVELRMATSRRPGALQQPYEAVVCQGTQGHLLLELA